MKPENLSALAASISAFSALITTYLYRKQGKGFVWTKDQKIHFDPSPDGTIYVAVQIPLFNLGTGNIRFKSLKVKKVYSKTNSIENFEIEMDEAYFPSNVLVANYQTLIHDDNKLDIASGMSTHFRIHRTQVNPEQFDNQKIQDDVNKKLADIGEVLFILKCEYKDGSWFGLWTKTTTIGLCLKGLDLSFLSTSRRKELDKLFK